MRFVFFVFFFAIFFIVNEWIVAAYASLNLTLYYAIARMIIIVTSCAARSPPQYAPAHLDF